MYRMKIHKNIHRMLSVFYRLGFWYRLEETVGQRLLKLFYSFYFCLFPISFVAKAITSDDKNEKMFSVLGIIISLVLLMKLLIIIWRKKEILELSDQICEYRFGNREAFVSVNDKSNNFIKFVTIAVMGFFFSGLFVTIVAPIFNPFVSTERSLFLPIGFPLDWKNSLFAYGMALLFTFTEICLCEIALLFSVVVWYLLANCGWRYEVLGQQIKKMSESEIQTPVAGGMADKRSISDAETNKLYLRDLVEAIVFRNELIRVIAQLDSFLSKVFAAQLTTSGITICTSVYCIAFMEGDNLIELLVYVITLLCITFEIFWIFYFGNEIKLTSDKLSYNLFESNWMDRSQSIRNNVLIFSKILVRPHQLIILKRYPLNLDTFRTVLNSAYRLFNILKNFK